MIESTNPGHLVREARLRSGLSQRELARRAGTSQAAISRVERGLEEPTIGRLEQILGGLGWRPVIELEPLAEHDEEPRRLLAGTDDTPAYRLASGASLARFAARMFGTAREAGG
jgi:transcriptional regulator with XRE-family HTH domain